MRPAAQHCDGVHPVGPKSGKVCHSAAAFENKKQQLDEEEAAEADAHVRASFFEQMSGQMFSSHNNAISSTSLSAPIGRVLVFIEF